MSIQGKQLRAHPTVAIIGGGFTGAAVAIHLAEARRLPPDARLLIVEPREDIGRGLAYGTVDPAHRINVPAGKMTIFPEASDDFAAYTDDADLLAADPSLIGRDGLPYPRRAAFGDYVVSKVQPLIASGQLEHWRTRIRLVQKQVKGYRLIGSDGHMETVDLVVIAVSHPAPAVPAELRTLKYAPKFIADVTTEHALEPIDQDDRVLIIGNGLTSADVVASLALRGHRGQITSISRRGLRSRGHGPAGQESYGDFTIERAASAVGLLREIRRSVREAQAQGRTWHSVLDAVRTQGQAIWKNLPLGERIRIVRHLRPFWDVHRFRIAPQVEDVVDEAIAQGRLDVLASSVTSATRSGTRYKVSLRNRYQRGVRSINVDAIVVTTGPSHGDVLEGQAFLRTLKAEGFLKPCPTGLGIACDRQSHAISANDESLPDILIAGPLARGTYGELMGLPQVTEHAVFVADRIAQLVADRTGSSGPLSKAS
ncbi:FAD dependent oxidoreductase [Rhizobium sp. PDO1-076]|uniref:FAD/NAD(P)-binding protein n=1 Tax=Rhizobium sp. PDO1-076 TaxID=1125979 RepID=UPI00024E3939|nr:FAD/NAD(P)-binding protein [Rhizobium sp. PDO1-076]EHS52069.1 FAD dependent oxidoreductase [Rhizobium sp. PDO1-076]